MASRFASVTEEQILSINEVAVPKKYKNGICIIVRCLFMRAKEHRAARFPLFIVCICCSIVENKANFGSTDYSACVVYTKTIIHLSVGENSGYLPPLR